MPARLRRRDFLTRLLSLPFIGPPTITLARDAELDFMVFPVAGYAFHEGPRIIDGLRKGQEVTLVPEPHNGFDPRAIRIEVHGRHIGYVPRSENRPLGRLLAQGAELRARLIRVQPEAEKWEVLRVGVSLRMPREAT